MNKTVFLAALLALSTAAVAQNKTPEQMGGVYYAYPVESVIIDPQPPKGYTPFYISHYGRHGSRFLPSDNRYEWVVAQLDDKKRLTAEGKKLRKQVNRIWRYARGKGGLLTNLGARQHFSIASRMVECFPHVFDDGADISARSSVVNRCKASMEAFVDGIKAIKPSLQTDSRTDSADMSYIAYTSPELKKIESGSFAKMRGSADRLMGRIFKNPADVEDPVKLMSELHTIASDMQDIADPELTIDLFWLFTYGEMYDMYECNNQRMAYCNGNDPRTGGVPACSAVSLWNDIVEKADMAIAKTNHSADLRFGHDTNLYRLLSLMQASSAKSAEMDEIIPMAANLQMIFFRDGGNDVIVRLLHNEQDFKLPIPSVMGNYYRWEDIREYMEKRIHMLGHEQRLATINTMVGTAQANTQTAGLFGKGSEEHGQTLPAVLVPNGQNFWTPQTRDTELKCIASYYYADSLWQGMRNSHWIVGGCTQDYGSFTIAALGGKLRTAPAARATAFSHDGEVSHPHYYAVALPDEHLRVELTASAHGAVMKITPDCDQMVHVVFQPNSDEGQGGVVVGTDCVYGYNPIHRIYQGWGEPAGYSGHLLMNYNDKPAAYGTFAADSLFEGMDSISGRQQIGAWISFDGKAGKPIVLYLASSFTGRDGCERNMAAEVAGKDFLQIMDSAAQEWNERMHTVDVEGNDDAVINQFYGALYRASFLPRLLSDADGSYPRFADGTMVKGSRPVYTDFSMWDTYRALHPLYNIIAPRQSADMMQSLVNMASEGGWLPIFPCWNSYTAAMIGDHCAVALADAYIKGIRGFDAEKAYLAMRRNAFETPADECDYRNGMGRRAMKSYLRYGYIPMEDHVEEAFHTDEQTSRTLEYAFDDFAVAQMAKALGHNDDYMILAKRASNWRNVINPRTGYADGRHADGKFEENQDIINRKSFITEGATCHYTWYVPHDPDGLIGVMGGGNTFVARLDSMFTEGRYWHGNEPCHQVPYMFNFAGRPDLTQKWVRHIMNTEYNDTPGGLSGNDDAGQMSAWFVFSAIGFYPVCPATDQYVLGSPLFRSIKINRPGGNVFTIDAYNADDSHLFIREAWLDSKPLDTYFISHKDITRGSTLRLTMAQTPK